MFKRIALYIAIGAVVAVIVW